MNNKPKLCVALLISLVPCRLLRILLYRIIFRYQISLSAKLGFATVIAVSEATIGRAYVGPFNRFVGSFSLTVEDEAVLSPFSLYEGDGNRDEGWLNSCVIGKKAHITERHYVDCSGGFVLGEGSWIAGQGSQFYTHPHWKATLDHSIVIDSGCYIGSAVRFLPGSGVGPNCVVGMGSVVTRRFSQNRVLIAGVPAKVVRSLD